MSFIAFEEVKQTETQHYLWVEKYRPNTLENYVGNQQLKDTVKGYIEKHDIPHLLFYGTAGTGKTTLAKAITKNIDCDVMYINASDENSTTRFILTCNYVEKIIPALVSRCQTYKIEPLSKKEVAVHLKMILDKESVQYTPEDLGYIVNTYYPDIRKILNYSQQSVLDGKIKISELNSTSVDVKNKVIELIKSKSPSAFNDIRQLIANSDIKHFEEIYDTLYDKVDDYSNGKQTLAVLVIAEYMYQSAMVVNKEITFMACIGKLLKDLK